MIELPTLYPHQEQMRVAARASLAKHRRSVVCAAPGVGKTRLAKWILGSGANREPGANQSGVALFAVHRRGLVDNASNSFSEHPQLPHGVIMSGRERDVQHSRVQVASIDTLLSWHLDDGDYNCSVTYDLVVFDECHSHLSKARTFLEAHDAARAKRGLHPAYVLGLSATPECEGINWFRDLVRGPSTEWLIEHGYLSPFRYFRATQGRLELLVKRGAEFTKNSVSSAMDGLAGDLVRDWRKFAEGRATVGFFPRLAHAMEAKELLERSGIRAEYVDGTTEDQTRRRLFAALNDGRIDYLCNVGVVERGTDIPRIGCVQLCTAVGSLVRYQQMIGRGSRVHPDKTDCFILDHAGNVKRHGYFEDDIAWTLDVQQKATSTHSSRPVIECPGCQALYRGGECSHCGYKPTARERKEQGLEFDGSELQEVKRRPQRNQDRQHDTPEKIMLGALFAAGRSRRTWKNAVVIAKSMAKKSGMPFKVPRDIEVAGKTYRMLPYGHPDSDRRVSVLFPWTVGDWETPCQFRLN